jgi:hypothetical protein
MAEHFTIKPDGSWEFHGEDSRLKDHTRNQVTYRIWNPLKQQFEYQTMDKVYCYNCGADGGYSSRNSPCIKFICDKCISVPGFDQRFIPMNPNEEWAWRNGRPDPNEETKKDE